MLRGTLPGIDAFPLLGAAPTHSSAGLNDLGAVLWLSKIAVTAP
jgi:hypothetical protein